MKNITFVSIFIQMCLKYNKVSTLKEHAVISLVANLVSLQRMCTLR